MRRAVLHIATAAAVLAGLAPSACTPQWKQTPHDQLFQREPVVALIGKPDKRKISDWWDRGTQIFVRPLGRVLSPGRLVEKVIGGRTAQDINAFGAVPDSEWYQNRISRRPFSSEEAFAGATRSTGPAVGALHVISGKLNGASPGFVVRDNDGIVWYLKLDPPASPELSTSAETISSRLLYLAGYHVAEIHALDVEPRRFVIDQAATKRDKHNQKIPFTATDLAQLVTPLNTDAQGRIRILASRQPEGEVLGPFDYRGTATDDANDRIPHEARRSLRGLWLFAAWINNTDTRNQNSLDMFRPVTADGRGIVRHYLLDFGNSFGATGTGEKSAGDGERHIVDWPDIGTNLVTFGLRYPPRFRRSPYRSVGLFESKLFDPPDWSPNFRNPAFDARQKADLFWAASVLARIQPEHIRAAVAAGYLHEEGAAEYIVQTLLERRRKLLEYGFHHYLEIDEPRASGLTLVVDDLRAIGGLPSRGNVRYSVKWNHTRGRDVDLARGEVGTTGPVAATTAGAAPATATATELRIDLSAAVASAHRTGGFDSDPFLTIELHRGDAHATVHVRVVGDRLVPVAVER